MTVANTSIKVFKEEIKGRTNWQNDIVLKVLKWRGVACTAKEIMNYTAMFTEDRKPLEINKVCRVLNDLREKHNKIGFFDAKEKLSDGKLGREVQHHYIKEEGVQTKLF